MISRKAIGLCLVLTVGLMALITVGLFRNSESEAKPPYKYVHPLPPNWTSDETEVSDYAVSDDVPMINILTEKVVNETKKLLASTTSVSPASSEAPATETTETTTIRVDDKLSESAASTSDTAKSSGAESLELKTPVEEVATSVASSKASILVQTETSSSSPSSLVATSETQTSTASATEAKISEKIVEDVTTPATVQEAKSEEAKPVTEATTEAAKDNSVSSNVESEVVKAVETKSDDVKPIVTASATETVLI